ncbi:MAG TPA: nodulation protein NfeD [Acidobacteriota bacterium]
MNGGWARLCATLLVLFPAGSRAADVVVADLGGPIHPIAAEYVAESLSFAAESKAALYVLRLDTPGGLQTSMDQIVKTILHAPVPVAVFVGPSGAKAASAGFYMVIAADIAAAAPGTNLGAATPVSGEGQELPETLKRKVESDAAAGLRSVAEKRGRNVELAEKAVLEGRSYSAQEALEGNLIDLVVEDVPALIRELNGREITRFDGRKVRLELGAVRIVERPMSWRQEFLAVLINPNLTFLLMGIGMLGLYIELTNPGLILPGVVGGVSLILAGLGLSLLPINYAGAALLALGMVLLVLEIKVTSYGLLTVGGVAAMILGGLILIQDPVTPELQLSPSLIYGVPIGIGLVTFAMITLVIRAHRRRPSTGDEGMLGLVGSAPQGLAAARPGMVIVHGEYWSAESDDPVAAGAQVEVVAVDGLRLKVRPIQEPREG